MRRRVSVSCLAYVEAGADGEKKDFSVSNHFFAQKELRLRGFPLIFALCGFPTP